MSEYVDASELVRALQHQGMTQAEIAELTGTTQATISRLRTKQIAQPSFALGVALHQLYLRMKDNSHE